MAAVAVTQIPRFFSNIKLTFCVCVCGSDAERRVTQLSSTAEGTCGEPHEKAPQATTPTLTFHLKCGFISFFPFATKSPLLCELLPVNFFFFCF